MVTTKEGSGDLAESMVVAGEGGQDKIRDNIGVVALSTVGLKVAHIGHGCQESEGLEKEEV